MSFFSVNNDSVMRRVMVQSNNEMWPNVNRTYYKNLIKLVSIIRSCALDLEWEDNSVEKHIDFFSQVVISVDIFLISMVFCVK